MEIKVQCRKDEHGWHIVNPGKVFVRERRVVWTFEGLEPGIVPLLAFQENHPHGPFPDVWLTGFTFTGELGKLPDESTIHKYDIVLVRWDPNPERSAVVAELAHELHIEACTPCRVRVCWQRGSRTIDVQPEVLPVRGASLVEWSFEVPEDVYATLDFGSPERGKGLLPTGPFADLHGRRSAGVYRLTGQADLVKDSYKYTVTLYDRKTDKVIIRHDPQIDNNGEPPEPPE